MRNEDWDAFSKVVHKDAILVTNVDYIVYESFTYATINIRALNLFQQGAPILHTSDSQQNTAGFPLTNIAEYISVSCLVSTIESPLTSHC